MSIIDAATQRNIDLWLNGDYDAETKSEIRKLLQNDPERAINAFYTNLTFGTGGLRGLMGVGCNRINQYTIMTATQGLVNYLRKLSHAKHSVLIGYDCRHNSRFFAENAARVLAANGIHVYISSKLCSTPIVSFGLRYKKCAAAIMITASHNPSQYNGYKIYWNDGGQVLSPHDKGITQEFNAITDLSHVKTIDNLSHELIEEVSEEIDDAYCKAVHLLQYYPEQNLKFGKELSVVFSNLHGTGITLMPRVLANWGFENLTYVEEQNLPDGNFPTTRAPNPEDQEALELGINKLKSLNGDILIVTDPDADRLGVAVRHNNQIHFLNGNQIACLVLSHICEALTKKNSWPERAAFIKTIPTTDLFQVIAEAYQKPCFNVLTGFKYVAELIHKWEQNSNGYQFIFGAEESCGYLLGTQSRDKDAILAGALVCEMALQAKLENKTLIEKLHDLYHKYGVHVEKLFTIKFEESKKSKQQMEEGLRKLRSTPPKMIGRVEVVIYEDYKQLISKNFVTGREMPLETRQSNMLVFRLADGSKMVVRPSGTEPKVKLYCGVVNKDSDITKAIEECEMRALRLLEALKHEFLN
jgi:phosphomannomutase